MKNKVDSKDWNVDVPKTRLAFIGAGTHASNMLFPSLNYLDFIERAAVCDLDGDRAKFVAQRFGFAKTYTDYGDMLKEEELDGVVVCINAKAHPKVVRDCMNAGVDVFVEKPASIYPEDSKELWEMSKELKRIVMVDHQKRGSIAYRKAMDIIKQPDFGEVMMIEAKAHGYPYETFLTCLLEWHSHAVDIFRAFGGDIAEMKAMGKRIGDNRCAVALACTFENGIVGTANWGTEGNRGYFCERLEVVAPMGGVIVENARKVIYYKENDSQVWESDWAPLSVNMTHILDGYVQNIKTFCEAVHSRIIPRPSLYDEWKNLEVLHEICDQLGFEKEWKVVIGER
ncbi:MAG: Gfo/Idh/MocA family oxidoreductase [Eubacteriales bacterium]|nr:Gfo/Idh/MocA family oxidoreductase [Eubacteriales bacterium]